MSFVILTETSQTKLYFLDGGVEYRETLKEDPAVPQSNWILEQVPNAGKPFTIGQVFELNLAREAFRSKVAAHWNGTRLRTTTGRPVDAILAPVAPTLAPPHDTTRWWGYTSYWNLMDFPAVVFPMGRLKAQGYTAMDISKDFVVESNPRNKIEESISKQWNPDTYDNAAVGLQLVGRRLNEEKLLGILRIVEDALRGSQIKV